MLCVAKFWLLFQTTKIQIFESNSQHFISVIRDGKSCFKLQRYKFLKAIHNVLVLPPIFWKLFQTTKIQIFESNSQRRFNGFGLLYSCFKLQRYKFSKAIHNDIKEAIADGIVVPDYKDTNFWKQFTTISGEKTGAWQLFQTTKIQTFESNSQLSLE